MKMGVMVQPGTAISGRCPCLGVPTSPRIPGREHCNEVFIHLVRGLDRREQSIFVSFSFFFFWQKRGPKMVGVTLGTFSAAPFTTTNGL